MIRPVRFVTDSGVRWARRFPKDDRHGEVHLSLPWPGTWICPTSRRSRALSERQRLAPGWRRIGPALVDVGSPFGPSTSVCDDGTEGTAGDLIGYSIVEADDLAAAKALTDGLPFLAGREGLCAVEIFELLPI